MDGEGEQRQEELTENIDESLLRLIFITQATKLFPLSERKSLKIHCLAFYYENH